MFIMYHAVYKIHSQEQAQYLARSQFSKENIYN